MLGLILDAGVMYAIIATVSGETPELLTAGLISFGFAVAMAVSLAFLGPFGAVVALVPVVALFGALLSALYGMPLNRAVLGAAAFLGYKLLMIFVWTALLG
jgi:hypothetical protein